MKQTIGYYCICTFLFAVSTFKINASQSRFEKVDSLLLASDLLGAVVECEKIAFYSDSVEIKALACLKQVECYKTFEQYEKAKNVATGFVISFSLSKEIQFELRFQTALCAHLSGNYNETDLHLAFLDAANFDSTLNRKTYLLRAFNAIELRKFEESKNWLEKMIITHAVDRQHKDSLLNGLEILYSKKNLPKIKSEKKAYWLGLVPGLGHIYAGEYKEALSAFMLNLAALSFGVFQIYNGYYLTGYFVGAGILVKLYYGSKERKDYLVEKRNFKEIKQFKSEVGKLIEALNKKSRP